MSNTTSDVFLAGSAAALVIDVMVYPFDTLKTRIQAPDSNVKLTNVKAFRGLYQGIGSVILISLPAAGAFFSTYEGLRHALGYKDGQSSAIPLPIINSLSSGCAELVSSAIITPAEVIKQNAQMITTAVSGSQSSSLQSLRKFSSPSQLWRGYTALVLRNLPFTAMQYPLFEALRTRLHERRLRQSGDEHSVFDTAKETALSAGAAGALSAWLTTPVDVVKTRIMLKASDSSRVSGIAIAKQVLREDGIAGLYRGALLRSVWTAVGSGLYLGSYEVIKRLLRERRNKEKTL